MPFLLIPMLVYFNNASGSRQKNQEKSGIREQWGCRWSCPLLLSSRKPFFRPARPTALNTASKFPPRQVILAMWLMAEKILMASAWMKEILKAGVSVSWGRAHPRNPINWRDVSLKVVCKMCKWVKCLQNSSSPPATFTFNKLPSLLYTYHSPVVTLLTWLKMKRKPVTEAS